MEIIDFDHDELSQLEVLLQASSNVSSIIDSLYILEITGKKDKPEYDKKLLELKKAISQENEEYESANLTYQKCLKYAKLISSKTNIPIFDIKVSNSFRHYNHRIFKRVINILMNILQNDEEFHKSIISNSLISEKQINDLAISENDMLRGLTHSFQIQMTLDNDINSMFLSILEDYIAQSKYPLDLIKVKYCIAVTNKDLESLILANRFNIPNEIFIGAKFMNELLHEGEISYDTIRFASLKTKAQTEISKLLKIKDSEYTSISTNIDSIISSCYIRALLSLMKDDEVKAFEKEFIAQIEKPEYLAKHLNDRISENIVLSCFKSFKYDKGRTRVLTTK